MSNLTKELSPATLATMAPESLVELANDFAEQSLKRMNDAVHFAVNAGMALNAAKEQTPHGQWGGWLKANWNYSHRWATNLMRLAANWHHASNLKEAESVRSALRMLDEVDGADDDIDDTPAPESIPVLEGELIFPDDDRIHDAPDDVASVTVVDARKPDEKPSRQVAVKSDDDEQAVMGIREVSLSISRAGFDKRMKIAKCAIHYLLRGRNADEARRELCQMLGIENPVIRGNE